MFKRLENPKFPRQEWTRNGTLINKPETGWLHPDKQLEPHAGVIYGVRVCIQSLIIILLHLINI